MTTDPQPVDRIPLAHSVHYVARGLPEVPNQYGPGVLVPSEITLTYRAAPDSQLGRVHAYVAGRIWVDGKELPLLPGGLYGQHYLDGLDNWPEWLAEEARLHDPERTTPPPADRAAVLREAAAAVAALREETFTNVAVYPVYDGSQRLALSNAESRLRRLADEAQQQPTDRSALMRAHTALAAQAGRDQAAITRIEQLCHELPHEYARRILDALDRADETQPGPSVHGESVAALAGYQADGHDTWAGEAQPVVTVHAVPLPGSNGISACCGRPPCDFVGERVTRDPEKVTCTGPAVDARQDGAQS